MIVMHPQEEQEPQDIDTLLSKRGGKGVVVGSKVIVGKGM